MGKGGWTRDDDYRAIDREDKFRKSAGDLGGFGLKTVIGVAGGATALLIGFRQNTIVESISEGVLPFTGLAVVVALVSIAFGYASLQNWANSIGFRPKSDGTGDHTQSTQFAKSAETQSAIAFWLYLASVALLAAALVVGLAVLYCGQ